MMLGTRSIRVWAFPEPIDLRKGFNGLWGLVERVLARDIQGGDLFLFVSRNRKAAKVLYWDGTGLVILHKRLERGTFPRLWARPHVSVSGGIALTINELSLFLDGCKLLEERALSPEDLSLILLAS